MSYKLLPQILIHAGAKINSLNKVSPLCSKIEFTTIDFQALQTPLHVASANNKHRLVK